MSLKHHNAFIDFFEDDTDSVCSINKTYSSKPFNTKVSALHNITQSNNTTELKNITDQLTNTREGTASCSFNTLTYSTVQDKTKDEQKENRSNAEQEFLYNTNISEKDKNIKEIYKPTGFEMRQNLYVKLKEMNLSIHKKIAEEKEKQQCTFQPILNKTVDTIRTADQFYNDQLEFTAKAHEKIIKGCEEKIQNESKELTYRPKINENSRWKSSKRSTTKQSFEEEPKVNQQPVINPKSRNLVRNESVDTLLYNDALRRKCSQCKISPKPNKSFVLESSKYYLIKLLETQLDSAYKSLNKPNKFLSKNEVKEILAKVGYYKSEEDLLDDMWVTLRGTELGGISYCNLFIFLLAVQNIYCAWMQHSSKERLNQQFVITESIQEEDEEPNRCGIPIIRLFPAQLTRFLRQS